MDQEAERIAFIRRWGRRGRARRVMAAPAAPACASRRQNTASPP